MLLRCVFSSDDFKISLKSVLYFPYRENRLSRLSMRSKRLIFGVFFMTTFPEEVVHGVVRVVLSSAARPPTPARRRCIGGRLGRHGFLEYTVVLRPLMSGLVFSQRDSRSFIALPMSVVSLLLATAPGDWRTPHQASAGVKDSW